LIDQPSEWIPARVSGDVGFPFDVRLILPPRMMEKRPSVPAQPGQCLFMSLGCFESDLPALRVEVSMAVIPRAVGPGDLADIAIEQDGDEVLSKQDCGKENPNEAFLLSEWRRDGIPWIRRTRVVGQGRYTFRIDAAAPEEAQAELAQRCATIAYSMHVVEPAMAPEAEDLLEHRVTGPVGVAFRYPKSWSARTVIGRHGGEIAHVEHVANGKVVGRISVRAVRRAEEYAVQMLIQGIADEWKAEGIHLSGAPIASVTAPDGFDAAFLYAPSAKVGDTMQTIGCQVLERKELAVVLCFRGSARTGSGVLWAIHKRAVEIVRDTLTLT
jgi:hypothetical protein